MSELGDPSGALEAVLGQFRALVRNVAARHALRDEDLDALVQDVRIRLWRGGSTSEAIRSLPTSYVYRTAMSAAVDLVRKRRRAEARFVEDGNSAIAQRSGTRSAEGETELMELAQQIEAILETMIPTRRVVVRMSLAGYTRSEIAERLNWTESKVRNLLSRGMEELRERLRQQATDVPPVERTNPAGTHD